MEPVYKRVLLKLSGEVLAGEKVLVPVGVDNELKTATVVFVQKYSKNERPPYPLDKVKKVVKLVDLEQNNP